jgi:hypothetical protein
VWNKAVCSFFSVSSDKRDVALLNTGLTNALGDKKPNESASSAKQICPALSNLSNKEKHLVQMLNVITVLPNHPFSNVDADILKLTAFIEQYGPLATADIRIYEVDVTNKLFAYELRFESARLWVMYNFSFDTHPLPLPLGFMASTKVTLYRTDNPKFERFVTNGPLSITYHSAVIVIVD